MAASTDAQQNALSKTHPPYPTYEALEAAPGQWVRPAPNSAQRLFWVFDGPLETAIAVFASPADQNPEACEPYYNASTGTWHPVASLPATEPRVSSITVHVSELAEWEFEWEYMHWKHSEPDMPGEFEGCEWGLLDGDGESEIKGDDNGEDQGHDGGGEDNDEDEPDLRPLRCCGMPRPRGKDVSIVVRPAHADGEDGGFVTVHDFVTTVHPWLMGLRGDILGAMGTSVGLDEPLPEDTSLVLRGYSLDKMRIMTRDQWVQHHKGAPVSVFNVYAGLGTRQTRGTAPTQ